MPENPSLPNNEHRALAANDSREAKVGSGLGKMRAPIFSFTRVTVRPRRGLKQKVRHPLRRSHGSGVTHGESEGLTAACGLRERQQLLRRKTAQSQE